MFGNSLLEHRGSINIWIPVLCGKIWIINEVIDKLCKKHAGFWSSEFAPPLPVIWSEQVETLTTSTYHCVAFLLCVCFTYNNDRMVKDICITVFERLLIRESGATPYLYSFQRCFSVATGLALGSPRHFTSQLKDFFSPNWLTDWLRVPGIWHFGFVKLLRPWVSLRLHGSTYPTMCVIRVTCQTVNSC